MGRTIDNIWAVGALAAIGGIGLWVNHTGDNSNVNAPTSRPTQVQVSPIQPAEPSDGNVAEIYNLASAANPRRPLDAINYANAGIAVLESDPDNTSKNLWDDLLRIKGDGLARTDNGTPSHGLKIMSTYLDGLVRASESGDKAQMGIIAGSLVQGLTNSKLHPHIQKSYDDLMSGDRYSNGQKVAIIGEIGLTIQALEQKTHQPDLYKASQRGRVTYNMPK
jgi:hypothetical protein